jgi:hypothetical protein
LIVHGTEAKDEIVVQLVHNQAADGVQVIVTPKDGIDADIRHEIHVKYRNVKRYRIEAGAGDDFVNISGGNEMRRPATILGGAGNDLIGYSSMGPTLVDAGDGNDQTSGSPIVAVNAKKNRDVLDATFDSPNGTAPATILGGAGDDSLNGDSNDQIDGGSGSDVAQLIALGKDVPDDRLQALAHDYYARLGATGVEQTKASSLSSSFTISDRAGFSRFNFA